MKKMARSYHIDMAIEKVLNTGSVVYVNLYLSELRKIRKEFPNLEIKEMEPIGGTHRKIMCLMRSKS